MFDGLGWIYLAMSKGIKGRGKTHSTSRAWEKALKKNGNKKRRVQGKKEVLQKYHRSK